MRPANEMAGKMDWICGGGEGGGSNSTRVRRERERERERESKRERKTEGDRGEEGAEKDCLMAGQRQLKITSAKTTTS